jgi:uncharacterized membrane protein YoaK (UPF0700 family)
MTDDGAFVVALLLAALAGWVDAAGLANSGHVFLSFMSGDTTDLAVSLTQQDWDKAGTIGAVLALFVAGVTTGELLEPLVGRRGQSAVLGVEALLLAAGAALHLPEVAGPDAATGFISLYPAVFAMGLQNATMHRAGGISIGLTYVTGTLVQVGRAVARVLRGGGEGRIISKYLGIWISLATGALLGTLALSVSSFIAMAVAAGVAALLAVVTAISRPPPAAMSRR